MCHGLQQKCTTLGGLLKMHIMLNIINFGTYGKKTKRVFNIQCVGPIIIYPDLPLLFYQYPSLYPCTWPSCIFQTRK